MDTFERKEVKGDDVVNETSAASLEAGTIENQEGHLGDGELEVIKIREGNPVLRKLREAELWMDHKLKIEGMGAERIPESQRRPPHVINVRLLLSLWMVLRSMY